MITDMTSTMVRSMIKDYITESADCVGFLDKFMKELLKKVSNMAGAEKLNFIIIIQETGSWGRRWMRPVLNGAVAMMILTSIKTC
jgi:hypothetical protein